MHKRLIVVLGPTGIGKSSMAINLAEQLETEIISCDSRQFYKEMTLGTAVPPPGDLQRVNHHFIQHISVESYYSASKFELDAIRKLDDLYKTHKDILMVGGSGLYIDAVCGTIDDIPDVVPEVRKRYLERFKEEGIDSLRNELKIVDPDYYSNTDIRNPKRILRALEIFASTGKAYSTYLKKVGKKRNFDILKIGLKMDRDKLYGRIEKRVDEMILMGLESEARDLHHLKQLNALNTVGYKELFDYFEKKITLEKAVEMIKQNSRRYAKRQLTWWARDKEISWFDSEDIEGIKIFLSTKK